MEWFIVLILTGGMLSLELMNSAIERVVDLVTTECHPLAKQAKDLAAGAVLIYAISERNHWSTYFLFQNGLINSEEVFL